MSSSSQAQGSTSQALDFLRNADPVAYSKISKQIKEQAALAQEREESYAEAFKSWHEEHYPEITLEDALEMLSDALATKRRLSHSSPLAKRGKMADDVVRLPEAASPKKSSLSAEYNANFELTNLLTWAEGTARAKPEYKVRELPASWVLRKLAEAGAVLRDSPEERQVEVLLRTLNAAKFAHLPALKKEEVQAYFTSKGKPVGEAMQQRVSFLLYVLEQRKKK